MLTSITPISDFLLGGEKTFIPKHLGPNIPIPELTRTTIAENSTSSNVTKLKVAS